MDILQRIAQLRDEREWTNYKLSKESGVSQTTLRNMFTRNTAPSISTLESLCAAFGITLSQFFSEGDEPVSLSNEQKDMLNTWGVLSQEQKSALLSLLHQFTNE